MVGQANERISVGDTILWIAAGRKTWGSWCCCWQSVVILSLFGIFLPDLLAELMLASWGEQVAGVLRQLPGLIRVSDEPFALLEGSLMWAGAFFCAYAFVLMALLVVGTGAYLGILSETLGIQSGAEPQRVVAIFRRGIRLTAFRGVVVVTLLVVIGLFVSVLAPSARFLLPLGLMAPVILAADGRSMGRAVMASFSLRYARFSQWGSLSVGFVCLSAGLLSFGLLGAIDECGFYAGIWSSWHGWMAGSLIRGIPGGAGYWVLALIGGMLQAVIFCWTGMFMVSLYNLSRRMAVA